MEKLKLLFVSSEMTPYAKSGGLGDVIGSLPGELNRLGVDARVVFPKYRSIPANKLVGTEYVASLEVSLGWRRQNASILTMNPGFPVYMIENDYYFGRDGFYGYADDFERFAFFSKAAVEFLSAIDFQPDVIHFNDWQTGLGSIYLNDMYRGFLFYRDIKTVYTIHNLQYQGVFGRNILPNLDLNDGYFTGGQMEFHGNISLMKAGILYANAVTTVSPTYAKEILTAQYGYGLDGLLCDQRHKLSGILNGIDYESNNPETDSRIFANYSVNDIGGKTENKLKLQESLGLPVRSDVPVFSIVSRLVDQKGLDLIAMCMDEMMHKDIQLIVLGTGDGRYEHMLRHLSGRYPGKVSANISFNETLAQKIYAASDFFLMPSLFEPCGLGQLIAMRYGTLPIVRRTGGLADTVEHFNPETGAGNGFSFNDYLASGLMWAVNSALSVYHDKPSMQKAVENAMNSDFSWKSSAKQYIELYKSLIGR